ncbi:arsenate reductase (thioredoxin) [Lactococcus kimchii]|uniref:arsenate reductase (thioredoxin) n=1 Tax=Lactococcus sp. S-13 TaxID=2507158 RepID=UPI001023C509|nr:arsenate reductase (thioredoxin) [Lactococcus sp. S-13]RZI48990.1 arsenate reductase (thioredoxin) [Lactococcus sp. S-13]
MPQVYFLCTGNSCRSQMAEGFARKFLPDWTIASAGVEKHGLNPRAVETMASYGIDISQNQSKVIDREYFNASDLIVTLCGDAKDKCPLIPAGVKHLHWDLPDPAGQSDEVFMQVSAEIKQRVKKLKEE